MPVKKIIPDPLYNCPLSVMIEIEKWKGNPLRRSPRLLEKNKVNYAPDMSNSSQTVSIEPLYGEEEDNSVTSPLDGEEQDNTLTSPLDDIEEEEFKTFISDENGSLIDGTENEEDYHGFVMDVEESDEDKEGEDEEEFESFLMDFAEETDDEQDEDEDEDEDADD